ncbi:hypothetical protein Nmel_008550 [Mimus melanotis]
MHTFSSFFPSDSQDHGSVLPTAHTVAHTDLLSFCWAAVKASTSVATPEMCLASIGVMPSSGMLFSGLMNATVGVCLAGFLHTAPSWPTFGCQNY